MTESATVSQLCVTDYTAPEDIRETITALVSDRTLFLCPERQPEVRIRCAPCMGYPFQKVLLDDGSVSHTQPLNRAQVAVRIREEEFTLKRLPRLASEEL